MFGKTYIDIKKATLAIALLIFGASAHADTDAVNFSVNTWAPAYAGKLMNQTFNSMVAQPNDEPHKQFFFRSEGQSLKTDTGFDVKWRNSIDQNPVIDLQPGLFSGSKNLYLKHLGPNVV